MMKSLTSSEKACKLFLQTVATKLTKHLWYLTGLFEVQNPSAITNQVHRATVFTAQSFTPALHEIVLYPHSKLA